MGENIYSININIYVLFIVCVALVVTVIINSFLVHSTHDVSLTRDIDFLSLRFKRIPLRITFFVQKDTTW